MPLKIDAPSIHRAHFALDQLRDANDRAKKTGPALLQSPHRKFPLQSETELSVVDFGAVQSAVALNRLKERVADFGGIDRSKNLRVVALKCRTEFS